MYFRTWVCGAIGSALALATLACSPPDQVVPPTVPPPVPRVVDEVSLRDPNDNEVVLTVVCPPAQANGPGVRVIVHPQLKEVGAGVDVVWTRDTRGTGTHSEDFSIDPEDPDNWPWEDGAFPWAGTTSITGTAKAEQQAGVEFKYNIRVGCNGDVVNFDPRMIIN